MRRSALWSAFILLVAAASYAGCTQNFDQFTSGSGGAGASGGATSTTGPNMGGGGTGGCNVVSECPAAGDCQTASCEAHNCKLTTNAQGSACPNGVCNGTACVECNAPTDCQDPPACQANTCDNHMCGTKNVDMDMNCSQGNLHCVGGMCVGCTNNGPNNDCPAPPDCTTVACVNMQCVTSNADPDTMCSTGFCDANGTCKECGTKDSECSPMNTECKTFTCVSNACAEADKSNTTTCTTGGHVCDGSGTCVDCNVPGDCPGNNANETCNGHTCGCTASTCAGLHLTCSNGVSDGCGNTLNCDNTMKDPNETDVDCGGPASGGTNHCPTRCMPGDTCNAGTDCVASANNCVDGVCCTSTCGAICMACNLTGTEGTCSPIALEMTDTGKCDDTHGACGGKCTCDGMGACLRQLNETCTNPGDCASGKCTGSPKMCSP